MKVGFIGLGRMGMPMVRNLATSDHEIVLWNRTAAKAAELADEVGASVATSPAALAEDCDATLTMLEHDASVIEVFTGTDGITDGLGPGKVAVDMSTVGPWTTSQIAGAVAATGAVLVDAPVSGSVPQAERATLLITAAGPDSAIDVVEPVLQTMGSPVLRMGDSGAGATIKLAINSVVFALNQALSEALVMAERAGVDRELAFTAFEKSAFRSPLVSNRRPVFTDPGSVPVYFTMDLVAKDLELALALAERVGADLPTAATSLRMVRAAIEAGMGDDDMGMAAVYMRDRHVADS